MSERVHYDLLKKILVHAPYPQVALLDGLAVWELLRGLVRFAALVLGSGPGGSTGAGFCPPKADSSQKFGQALGSGRGGSPGGADPNAKASANINASAGVDASANVNASAGVDASALMAVVRELVRTTEGPLFRVLASVPSR